MRWVEREIARHAGDRSTRAVHGGYQNMELKSHHMGGSASDWEFAIGIGIRQVAASASAAASHRLIIQRHRHRLQQRHSIGQSNANRIEC